MSSLFADVARVVNKKTTESLDTKVRLHDSVSTGVDSGVQT
jgi:hypothetical protein